MTADTNSICVGQARFARDAGTLPAKGWSAVFAMSLCAATLVASEFMPVSLLTPIATDLHLTEGQAGQAIAVSGLFAVLTSLFIAPATPRLDRRALLLGLTVLMLVSGLAVAFAPNAAVFLGGRALVGMVIGGFWSLSAATVMRLVPAEDVPRGLAILNGGNAMATTVAAPLGSFLGQYIGWRGAFFCVVPVAAVTFAWLSLTLPAMPNRTRADAFATFKVLRRPRVPLGMLAAALFFLGQFALFTYLRPFLETVTRVDTSTLSALLLVLGISGLVGTSVIGRILQTRLYGALVAMPLAMALLAVALIGLGSSLPAAAVLLAFWGLIGTAAPVGWWTWVSKALPDDAEAGGGLMVAVVQLAITGGAALGGLLFDHAGYRATFTFSALVLVVCAVTALLSARADPAAGNH
ncbi:Purine ribonucleoside efflux pump NepI [Methylobacterium dankookense]|uniref:Purine ribonucleoside efflux pump NepI n=2 Tax=Methylobacterium dankookense TaxID=560405 RepID=A0A564FS04_9HYPH|nr:Purine ribonucleoside efflux pump NepI [Methylobacterium dankookense]VUF10510.1 Purine ribonucleoside efflux pump NepI [Methylobacterium dankookense]